MRIFTEQAIKEYAEAHPDAKVALQEWTTIVKRSEWTCFADVKKTFNKGTINEKKALQGLELTLQSEDFVTIIGGNGAGKSTTMNIITGYLASTEGEVLINGHNILEEPEEAKKCIGYLPELPPVYTDMTVLEYLKFVAELKKIPKDQRKKQILEVMNLVKITDMQNRLIKNLSKGYRQRVGLAQAVLGYPPIIILDEPTVGLDPKQIIEIRDLIKSLGKKHTVILSSHILSEVSAVCDYVMIIAKGQLVASDTPENLSKLMLGSNTVTCTVHGTRKQLVPALNALDAKEIQYENTPNEEQIKVKITTEKDKDIREELFYALAKANCPILELTSSSMSLEDVFLELTDDSGKAARKLKKAEKEQLKQKECEKECEPEADKTAVGETSEEKSTDAAESAAETKQEEGDAQ